MNDSRAFEQKVLPHLDAGYNLARWLLRNGQNADDALQESVLRALRYFDTLREADARPWFLSIVRNTCFTLMQRVRRAPDTLEFDDEAYAAELAALPSDDDGPELALQRKRTRAQVDAAIRALSPALREVLILREFEELDYAQIARIVDIPIGTVMSRLSRARERLRQALAPGRLGA